MISSSALVISGLSRCTLEDIAKASISSSRDCSHCSPGQGMKKDATRGRSPAFPQIEKNSFLITFSSTLMYSTRKQVTT